MKSKGKEEIVKERERQKNDAIHEKEKKELIRENRYRRHTHTHTHSLNWETMGGETERNSVRKSGRNGKIVWKKRERKATRESSPKGEKRGLCAARKVRKF